MQVIEPYLAPSLVSYCLFDCDAQPGRLQQVPAAAEPFARAYQCANPEAKPTVCAATPTVGPSHQTLDLCFLNQ